MMKVQLGNSCKHAIQLIIFFTTKMYNLKDSDPLCLLKHGELNRRGIRLTNQLHQFEEILLAASIGHQVIQELQIKGNNVAI